MKCPECGSKVIEMTEVVEREVIGQDGKPAKQKVVRKFVECPKCGS